MQSWDMSRYVCKQCKEADADTAVAMFCVCFATRKFAPHAAAVQLPKQEDVHG